MLFTQSTIQKIKSEISKIVINQEQLTDMSLIAMLCGGHVLIEGVPGLAKTLWVKTLAATLDVDCKRVQFTSDLMPSDILGTKIFDAQRSEFALRRGPLFTNLFLADEINRTPPKTQSALLEVMEERSITIDGDTTRLAEPFIVFATQNPIEYEGTYPLPEALTDRFMMKISTTYPGVAAEREILHMHDTGAIHQKPDKVCTALDIARCREEIAAVKVDDSIYDYIVTIIEFTRRTQAVQVGASPRGSIALLLCAKASAAVSGRDFVIPEDIRDIALPILRHRILLKPEAEIDGVKPDQVIESIMGQIKVPR
ncbi:MAG: MoxR family ATPase [Clostridiales bacterium]|jgi:MoxR-like ATPase|nr:MoxR family ATPase [Clostridiales bacterium]